MTAFEALTLPVIPARKGRRSIGLAEAHSALERPHLPRHRQRGCEEVRATPVARYRLSSPSPGPQLLGGLGWVGGSWGPVRPQETQKCCPGNIA